MEPTWKYEDRFIPQVLQGAAWLDEHKPGWERTIDLSTLDLSDCAHCVLGQAFMDEAQSFMVEESKKPGYLFSMAEMTGWTYALTRVMAEPTEVSGKGFSLNYVTELGDPGWTHLGDTWGKLLKERFDSGMLSDEKEA